MNSVPFSIYLAIGVASALIGNAASSEILDYRLLITKGAARAEPPVPKTCEASGAGPSVICSNCNHLALCLNGNEVPFQDCAYGESCVSGSCQKDGSAPCNPFDARPDIPCQGAGVFPDPGDCTKYHFCTDKPATEKWVSVPKKCDNPDKYGYNPRTTYCDRKLPTGGGCGGYPIPLCTKAITGIPQALAANPSLYYVCSDLNGVLYPFQLICPNGGTFSPTTRTCRSP